MNIKTAITILTASLLAASCNRDNNSWDATGTFEATEIIISAQSNGKILSLDLLEGETINSGAELGTIDTMQLYLVSKELEVGLKAADIKKPNIQKQIAVLNSQLLTAQSELKRAERLVAADAGNQKSVDDINNTIKLLESQIEAQQSTLNKAYTGANAEIERLQYKLMQNNDLLEKCKIESPITGTVLTKYANAGEFASVGKPLFKVADLEIIYLRAYLTTKQLESIKLGKEVEVATDNGAKVSGKVTYISPKSEFTPKGILTKDERANLVYAVKIAVKNSGDIKIGQYGYLQL